MTTSDTGDMMLRLLWIKPRTAMQLYDLINRRYPVTYVAITQCAFRYRKRGLLESRDRRYQLTKAGREYVGRVRCPHCGKEL